MGVYNRRNALVGWTVMKVVRSSLKKKAATLTGRRRKQRNVRRLAVAASGLAGAAAGLSVAVRRATRS